MSTPAIPEIIRTVFGDPAEPMTAVELRARTLFPTTPLIVWEADADPLAFTYVGGDAEYLLGYPVSAWYLTPSFWADTVVCPEDREDVIEYCARTTRCGQDHRFEYRARRHDGGIVWLTDYVTVLHDAQGRPVKLRGLMFDVTAAKRLEGRYEEAPTVRIPALAELR